jgi:hypothetical protein
MEVLGICVEASLDKGIIVSLNRGEDIEEYPIGSIALLESGRNSYLAIINNVRYSSNISPSIASSLPERVRSIFYDYLREEDVENHVNLIPIAKAEREGSPTFSDTLPPFGSRLIMATPEVISRFYGLADWRSLFPLGRPKLIGEPRYSIPVDVRKLVNLNFGIYGKSGSGKTFVANLLIGYCILYGLLNRDLEDYIDIRFLIFDMHDEYSLSVLDNNRRPIAKGVANIFRDRFVVFTPDLRNSRDFNMRYFPIPLYGISTNELRMIIEPMGVTQAFQDNLKTFERIIKGVLANSGDTRLGDPNYWVLGLILSEESMDSILYLMDYRDNEFIEADPSITRKFFRDLLKRIDMKISRESPAAYESFKAGRRRLIRLLDMPVSFKKRYAGVVDEIVDNLLEPAGKNVAISMGRYERSMTVYLALANIVGNRLKTKLREKVAEGVEDFSTKIVILLEEAHKFLGRHAEIYSPFGVIAREMRKRGVIVVPIDQKPGELDPDVTSMIWTNIVFALTDPNDVSAALSGITNPKLYEGIVYSLKPGEAIIYGPAVKFPVVLSIESYADASKRFESMYKEILSRMGERSIFDDDLSRD